MQAKEQLRKIGREVYPLLIDVLKVELEYTLNKYIDDPRQQEVCRYLRKSIEFLEGVYSRKISLDKPQHIDTPKQSF